MALSAEAILAHTTKFETREVHIPSWVDESGDDVVLVRGLTAAEWDAHQASMKVTRRDAKGNTVEGVDQSNVTAKLVVKCIIDADGKRLFTDQQAAQVGMLPLVEIGKLGEAILDLSGMTPEAEAEIEGNSEAAQSGDSSSGSPETSA